MYWERQGDVFVENKKVDNDDEVVPIVSTQVFVVQLATILINLFSIRVQLQDLLFHPTIGVSNRCRNLHVVTLKVKEK